ncbi:TPR repeat protein [Entamoeba histolytica HM-1:IMSS-B]|uniref:TPR repeat protein n=6 Tax=Entamoeba histolytica TaxID=5759 RepID=C4M7P7_ENTH1|nr:TPR repeat protein [Entamoeba histolytica HM-1:IMSS]EMH72866.1 TPR repeat protein [Entamoeba histolytica HM-1:IMSS-B]EMS12542.1 tetratricopeptide repeat protein [Entamoeba histolytica HM-3:IMSS]ENY63432.1 tetratricopeptide repeat protein [Entamoeba histolytica HM-1:IMSS-A]GAT97571.1 tpr repeat protein [Entamoeba histolytica]EAL45179.1 TPR repeat protein [Entamoeba histolytica HM-1:IMSS]|eukprot:XP_650565.1 TPR repeat protein [Entamoeba histolytica HM-1:IMSS]
MEHKSKSKQRKCVLDGVDIEKVRKLSRDRSLVILKIRNFGTLNIGNPQFMSKDDEESENEGMIEIPVKKETHLPEKHHHHHHSKKKIKSKEEPQIQETTQKTYKQETEIVNKKNKQDNIYPEDNETSLEERINDAKRVMAEARKKAKERGQPTKQQKPIEVKIPEPLPNDNISYGPKRSKGFKIEEIDDNNHVIGEITPMNDQNEKGVPKNFANATNDPQIDQELAIGYLLVNNGKLQEAINYLTKFLQKHPDVCGGYIARGTAYAMIGQYQMAVEDFGSAVIIDPRNADAHKRRGQTLIALGKIDEALVDMNDAVKYGGEKDVDCYKQRGICYQMIRNYELARDDFGVCVKRSQGDYIAWNHYGLNNTALGLFKEAAEAFGRAVSIKQDFVDGYVNLFQLLKDAGKPKKAEEVFKIIFRLAPNHCFAHYLRGVLFQQIGHHIKATKEFAIAISNVNNQQYGLEKEIDKQVDLYRYNGVTLSASGQFKEAIRSFDQAVDIKSDDSAWYMKEVALYTHHLLDHNFTEWNIDSFDPLFKEGFCKHLIPAALHRYEEQASYDDTIPDVSETDLPSQSVIDQILIPAMNIGKYMQYDSQGFVHNASQYLMGGLAAINIGQYIRETIPEWIKGGLDEESARKLLDKIQWRTLMELSTKWRQISEPNDPVYWIDLLTPEQFEEGFGSHTPMYTGQGRVIRYFCQYDRAFKIVQELLPKQVQLKPEWVKVVKEAKNIGDILRVVESNFQVTTPCRSDNFDDPKTGERIIYEGTNLVTEMKEPVGYDFAIKTPCKKSRWILYDKELEACWKKLALLILTRKGEKSEEEKILRAMFSFTFFWYNFMPLTRGTAAGGFVFMMSVLASIGKQIGKHIPQGMQTDWEAILCEYPHKFSDVMYNWMKDSIIPFNIESVPKIEEQIPTVRKVVECFNYCPQIKCE